MNCYFMIFCTVCFLLDTLYYNKRRRKKRNATLRNKQQMASIKYVRIFFQDFNPLHPPSPLPPSLVCNFCDVTQLLIHYRTHWLRHHPPPPPPPIPLSPSCVRNSGIHGWPQTDLFGQLLKHSLL